MGRNAHICNGARVSAGARIGDNSIVYTDAHFLTNVKVPSNTYVITYPTTSMLFLFLLNKPADSLYVFTQHELILKSKLLFKKQKNCSQNLSRLKDLSNTR